jgi:hypothetical protein
MVEVHLLTLTRTGHRAVAYNIGMERKIFWLVFILLSLLADLLLPFWWGFVATLPILFVAWWVAYRSDWL